MRTPDHSFIAGELAMERHSRSSEPDERMEPQSAQGKFVEYADQIIAPSCVGEFVKQDSIEFPAD
jgi:hypothetical protein